MNHTETLRAALTDLSEHVVCGSRKETEKSLERARAALAATAPPAQASSQPPAVALAEQEAEVESLVSYRHPEAKANGVRFKQLSKDPLPPWAVDVQPYVDPDSQPPAVQGVPAGWKLVPIEPTERMVHAGEDVEPPRPFGKVYRAMIAAAPQLGEQND